MSAPTLGEPPGWDGDGEPVWDDTMRDRDAPEVLLAQRVAAQLPHGGLERW